MKICKHGLEEETCYLCEINSKKKTTRKERNILNDIDKEFKQCDGCGKIRKISCFYQSDASLNGYCGLCKDCR